MSVAYPSERRLLAEAEIEPIQHSHFPLLEGLPREELLELARWLRSRRTRARDLLREQRRVSRGKAEPRGTAPPAPGGERGLAAKKQVFSHALKRVNARLGAVLAEEHRARRLAALCKALERRRDQTAQHPDAGRTPRRGPPSLPSRAPRPTIHGARIGSTSQAGRVAQAQRDARA
ncbi:MAG: hypothetical protein QJR07_16295 [Acetobacteraceae bacterium]|nr:hypothetical protein [Acetobacteraceae bacterium]